MAIFFDEAKPLKLYNGSFYYPIDLKDRFHNSIVYLMTPNIQSSINVLNHPLTKYNQKQFYSFFMERNIVYILQNNMIQSINRNNETTNQDFSLSEAMNYNDNHECVITENALMMDNGEYKTRMFFNDFVDEYLENNLLSEADETFRTKFGSYNLSKIFGKLLFKDRMKSQQDCIKFYNMVKEQVPYIRFTYTDYKLYKNRNLYYDWSFYNELYFNKQKSIFKHGGDRALDVFFGLINRFIMDRRFLNTYKKRTIVVPVSDWCNTKEAKSNPFDFHEFITPISLFTREFKVNPYIFKNWECDVVFLADKGFFKLDLEEFSPHKDLNKFRSLIVNILSDNYTNSESIDYDSKPVIINQLADQLSKGGIVIHNLTGGTEKLSKDDLEKMGLLDNPETGDNDVKKAALVNQLDKIASKSTNTKDALKDLEVNDDSKEKELIKNLLIDIQSEDGVKMNQARIDRMNKSRKELLDKQIRGKSVKDLLKQFESNNDLKEEALPIDSIDDGWKHLKFTNFNHQYTKEDMDADIVAVFNHFNHVTHPMNVLFLDTQNTSTAEDYIDTWTVKYEDAETGKRFTIVLDLPRMINDRFMMLRGNEKVLISQFMLLPVIKTNEDEVQMVSNYSKIFIRRKSPSGKGKSNAVVNKLMRALLKYNGDEFRVIEGDNSKVCSKFVLPIDYIDLASTFNRIEFKDGSWIDFNMQSLQKYPFNRDILPVADKKLTDEELSKKYFGIYVVKGKRLPITGPDLERNIGYYINKQIGFHDKSGEFKKIFKSISPSKKLMFSEASVMNMKVPVIVVLSYNIGLQKVLDKQGVKYHFTETRPTKLEYNESFIPFSDGYLKYETYNDADELLMNGLSQFDTSEFSIEEINTKDMWLSILDEFGGRIKGDGLDNFYDLFMDPITQEICKNINIPSDYVGAMLYGNNLLTDNKFNKHTDITGNRLRTNEIIVGHLYHVLSGAYGTYRNQVKRSKGTATFSEKRSAVIDSILTHDQTSSDLSTLTPLLEAEAANKVTFKGLSGMNSERAFSIDKRTYDDSMLGVVGISTGFASTVGINRQLTIDASIKNKRGFISPKKPKELSNTNTFSMMEALSPMAINHDDPFRTAMAYTQTSQHQMTVKGMMPSLITSGADQALPYLTSNKFSYKFRGESGHIKEITNEYIIVEDDKTKECDFIDIRERIRKNSDGGFYLTTKLDPISGLKVGSKVKYNDILAYDRGSYSPSISSNKNPQDISYNIGTIAKVAIMNTDMGFEDSCVVDEYVSEALSTELCFLKEVNLDRNANVYNLVEPGQEIQANDPLLIFQDAFDEKEANELLRKISLDQDEISDIARKKLRSKVAGVIQDIKIYRTCELKDLSPTLRDICEKYDKRINKLKSVMKKNNIDKEYELESTGKLAQQGKLKNLDGVRIEIYTKTKDTFGSGDKLVFYQALKGVASYVIPKDVAPYTDYHSNETVGSFLSVTGVFKRMVPSAISYGLLTKLLIELSRQSQEDLGIKWRPIQEIITSNK